jgi:uncharacterized membrane protein
MVKNANVGLIVGLLLAIAVAVGGLLGLLGAIVLGGLGYAIGAYLDGNLDLGWITRPKGRG